MITDYQITFAKTFLETRKIMTNLFYHTKKNRNHVGRMYETVTFQKTPKESYKSEWMLPCILEVILFS